MITKKELLDDYGIYEYPDYFVALANEWKVPQEFITVKKAGFQIPYEIKESQYGGRGIFATERIPINTLIWRLVRGVNIALYRGEAEARAHLEVLGSADARYQWLAHVYCFDGTLNEILDDGKMWNHSETPNTSSGYEGSEFNYLLTSPNFLITCLLTTLFYQDMLLYSSLSYQFLCFISVIINLTLHCQNYSKAITITM